MHIGARLQFGFVVGALWAAGACGADGAEGAADASAPSADAAIAPYTCDHTPGGPFAPGPTDTCDLVAQDCPTTGEACYVGAAGARCLTAGAALCGGSCQYANDCPPGSICVGSPGLCRALCLPGEACTPGTSCRALGGRDDVGFCPQACSVLAQGCPAPLACYLVGAHQECAPSAQPSKGAGDACAYSDECAPGLVCQDPANPRCLVPCSTDGAAPCASGRCAPLEGAGGLGVCVEG